MASVAAQRSTAGAVRDAVARLVAAARTETGVMVCTFLVLRLVATAHAPIRYPDTATYEILNFLGESFRLWTVPAIWNVFPGADMHVVVQIALGMFAWSLLAVTLSQALAEPWVRRVAVACVLMLGLVVQVTGWDATLLSESIAGSLFVLETALLLRLARGATPRLLVVCVAVAGLWMFTRQVNVLLYLVLAPVAIGLALAWLPRRRAVAVAAAVLAIGAWGLVDITRDTPQADAVWHSNALGIIVDKIAPDPSALRFFVAHGLPQPPELMRERGHFLADASPLFRDARFMRWVQDHFRMTYFTYLLHHPRYALWQPLAQLPVLASVPLPTGKATNVLPQPVAQFFWPTTDGDIPFWAVVALALLLTAWAVGVRDRRITLPLVLVIAGAVLAIISYDASTVGPFRYFIAVGLIVRLGLLLAIAISADRLIRWRREQVLRGPVPG